MQYHQVLVSVFWMQWIPYCLFRTVGTIGVWACHDEMEYHKVRTHEDNGMLELCSNYGINSLRILEIVIAES